MKFEAYGETYKGEYQNDKKCGYGELSNENGEIYVGNF